MSCAAGNGFTRNSAVFFQSYEVCLRLTEWLEKELDDRWHSSDREASQRQPKLNLNPPPAALPSGPIAELPPPTMENPT